MSKKLLILGGTNESYKLANSLFSNFISEKLIVISSLSGSTLKPRIPYGEFRIGSFGGFSGLKNYLKNNDISIVINATHPFASKISLNAHSATKELGISYFRLSRPPWERNHGDRWIDAKNIEDAASLLIKNENSLINNIFNKNIFLSIGSRELHYFNKCNSYKFLIRTIDKPKENLIPKSIYLHERGPFSIENEMKILKKYSIKLLISKNSGGEHTYPKIEASRKLNIPVIMVKQPILNSTKVSYSIDEAIDWISKIIKNN